MKIIVLTNNGSIYGKKLLNEFISKDIHIYAVVVIKQPINYYLKLFKYVKKKVGFSDAMYFSIRQLISTKEKISKWEERKFINKYKDFEVPINYSKATNSKQTIEILKSLEPDLLVLGQTGIIKKNILKIPKMGTLNSHPGILPYYRGIDCEKWTIFNDDFVNIGCSVHWVDKGVDTGSIISTVKYKISKNETLKTLNINLNNLAVRMLAKIVLKIIKKNTLDEIIQNNIEGKQYYKMSRKKEAIVRNKLTERTKIIKIK